MQQRAWANGEFGHTKLGDRRRTLRLVSIATAVLERPAGTVTRVFGPGAEREGAYRFLESPHVAPEAMERARNIACARRMDERGGVVVVPVDQTSIQLSDREQVRGFGSVGTRRSGARGVQVMTCLALDRDGAPVGVLHQKQWVRCEEPSPTRAPGGGNRKCARDNRPPEERESIHWVEALQTAAEVAAEHAPQALPWFQCDRGADFWGVFSFAAESGTLVTVRMNRSHVVRDDERRRWQLTQWLGHRRVAYLMTVTLPAHDGRPQRTARLTVRFGTVDLALPVPGGRQWVPLSFVYVHEPRPHNQAERISWILGTTHQVDTAEDAARVIENYTLRWRVEDFFRTWKSGSCDIESSQLQSPEAFHRWSIITSSMAARAEHIKHHSRLYPDAKATVLFSQEEIDTLLLWRHKHMTKARPPYQPGNVPSLKEMTRWVAELGGFMKSSKAPPPGAVAIMRGLEYLEKLVQGRMLQSEPDL